MPDYRWTCVTTEAPFAARDGAGALVFVDAMWLLGGWNPGDPANFPTHCNSEVWRTTDGLNWQRLVDRAPWEERHTAGYVVHDGRMFIVGGDPLQGHYQDNVWFSADGLLWECVLERAPWGPRVLHYTVEHDGRIWVMGGQTLPQFAPADERFYNDVWCSENGRDWQCVLERAPWSPRGMIGGAAIKGGRIWLLGGGTYDTPDHPQRQVFPEVWSTADGRDWQRHADAPCAARQYHDVAVFDDRLWIMEGCTPRAGNRNDVWCSADGEMWQELPDTPWAPRHAASVFVYRDALWMVAGNNMTPDVWKLERG